jgi:hypothetical protein
MRTRTALVVIALVLASVMPALTVGFTGKGIHKKILPAIALSRLNPPSRGCAAFRLKKDRGYRTTKLGPDLESAGGVQTLQVGLAERISATDFIPDDRRKHFLWLAQHSLVVTGWYGVVTDVSGGDKAWLVTIKVGPSLSTPGGGVSFTPDHYFERYEVTPNCIRYLGGRAPMGFNRMVMVD